MPTQTTLTLAIPSLATDDLARSVAFYQELGFVSLWQDDATAFVRRDTVTLQLWLTYDETALHSSGCRVHVAGIDALYARCQELGVVHPHGPLAIKSWGLREFMLLEPSGHTITFAEPA